MIYTLCNYFLPFHKLPFYSTSCFPHCIQRFFIWDSPIYLFLLMLPMLLMLYPINHCQEQCHRVFSPKLSSLSFTVSGLAVKSLINFLIDLCVQKKGSVSFFCVWIHNFLNISCFIDKIIHSLFKLIFI